MRLSDKADGALIRPSVRDLLSLQVQKVAIYHKQLNSIF